MIVAKVAIGLLVFFHLTCKMACLPYSSVNQSYLNPIQDEAVLVSLTENPVEIDLDQWDHFPKKALPVRSSYSTENLWWISHLSISKEQLIAHFDRNELIAFRRPGMEKLAKITIPKDNPSLSSIHNHEIAVYSVVDKDRFIGISLDSGKKLWTYQFHSQDAFALKQWNTLYMNQELVLMKSQISSYAYHFIALDIFSGEELWRSRNPSKFLGAHGSKFLLYEADQLVCYNISPGNNVDSLWKSKKPPFPHGKLFEQHHPMRIANINEKYFFYPTHLKLEEYGYLIQWDDGEILQEHLKTDYAQNIQFDNMILAPGLIFHVTENHLLSCVDLASMSELWRIQFKPHQFFPPEAQKVYDFESLDLLVQDETIWINIQAYVGDICYKVDKNTGKALYALPFKIDNTSNNALLHVQFLENKFYDVSTIRSISNETGAIQWNIQVGDNKRIKHLSYFSNDIILLDEITVLVLRNDQRKIFGMVSIDNQDHDVVFYPVPDSISLHDFLGKDASSFFFWDEEHNTIVEIEIKA